MDECKIACINEPKCTHFTHLKKSPSECFLKGGKNSDAVIKDAKYTSGIIDYRLNLNSDKNEFKGIILKFDISHHKINLIFKIN